MVKTASFLSLRALMLLLVGLMVGISLFFAAQDLRQSQIAYLSATQLAERNSVADHCLRAVMGITFERGRSHVLLLGRDSVNPEKRRLIAAKRVASDGNITEILAHLPEDSRAAGETLRSAWESLKSLRPDVDRDLNLTPAQRDPALPDLWLVESNRLVASLENLLLNVSTFSGNTDATFARLSDLRVLALKLRVISGSASHLFASQLSSGHIPSHEVLDALHLFRGRSLQIESQLFPGMLALSDPAATLAVARVKSELFGRLHALQDEMIRAREGGSRVPVLVDNYLEISLAALDSTIELSNAINSLAEKHARTRLAQAQTQSFTSLIGITTMLLLGCFAALVMTIRFTRPLNEVLKRIDRLLHTHSESLHPAIATADRNEFAKVQQALQYLDEAIEARLKSELALHESERLSSSVLASIPQSIIATDLNGVITVFSAGAEEMLGYSAEEVVGRQTTLLFHDPEEVRVRAEQLSRQSGKIVEPGFEVFVQPLGTKTLSEEHEWTYLRKNGERIAVLLSSRRLKNANGEVDGCIGVASDITERKLFENKLRENAREKEKQNNLLNALMETIPVGVFMVEAPSGNPLVANDAARLLLGRGVLPGVHKDELSTVYAAYKMPARIPYPVEELPLVKGMQGESSRVEDMLVVGPDGTERILEVMGAPVRDSEGRVWASVVSFIDITGRAQSTAKMTRLAHYDSLTGLPNRRLFHDRMQVAITQARREKSRLALMMIDLDRFKPVNDNLGHAIGDLLLKAVAGRMQLCLRESDTLARVGGDEFFVILPGLVAEKDAVGVAEKIRQVIDESFDLEGGYQVSIACCIGIAFYPEHGLDEKLLTRNADEAMYEAKALGRNRVQIFSGISPGGDRGKIAVPHSILHLVWRKSYKCGEAAIDQEHQELFELANKLISATISGNGDSAQVSSDLEQLISSVVNHFSHEEAVLAEYKYAGLADHALQHQRLVGRALELRRLAAEGELSLGDLVVFIAQEVVVKHMLHEDKKYFEFLQAAMKKTRSEVAKGERVD